MRTGQARTALVIGAEKLSCFLDWTDRGTCVLFGDGAGAVVLTTDDGASVEARGLIGHRIRTDGRYLDILHADGGPSSNGKVGHVRMTGREVYRHAVTKMADVVEEVCAREGVDLAAIDWFVPHQANLRIIEVVAERLGIGMEKVIVTIARHGNTSAASIPLALGRAVEDGRVRRGDLLCFASLGGGISWGASLLRF
jgi:3-oxoacyl-[acyl-carrier-protein] synthase-3